METLDDIIREVRAYGSQPPPRLMWLDIADRIEAAHKAALVEKAKADARAWSPLIDATERREAAAVAMYRSLCSAVRVYLAETAPLPGANSDRVLAARKLVEESMTGGAE